MTDRKKVSLAKEAEFHIEAAWECLHKLSVVYPELYNDCKNIQDALDIAKMGPDEKTGVLGLIEKLKGESK